MASHRELMIDWNMLDNDCNNWTLQDLQLAAELGRTLLERNEELETELKQQQVLIDDQGQEIEFLTKQVNSMKEESANRSKIYEQLESSICELEKTNSQISRKHEVDKKRIQSLCENIEYLEKKCDELNVTLQSLKNDQGKKPGSGGGSKVNRSSYFSFGSDSSESSSEEMMLSSGFGLFRLKSRSLQDLRDYTPSPDEFDSGNSNSPDLKTSEAEFIDSLENRIEELITSRNKENDKVRQLETKIKILVQENANLQQQIVQLSNEKDEEVSELRKILRDSSLNGSYPNLLNSSLPPLSSTRRNSESNSGFRDSSIHAEQSSSILPNASLPNFHHRSSSSSICKRCAAEIQILNLVNSIEDENDGNSNNLYDWEFGNPDDDMEFSSLEHELAKATGTPYSRRRDNRFSDDNFNFNNNAGISSPSNQTVPIRRSSLEANYKVMMDNDSNSNSITPTRERGLDYHLRHKHSSHIDVDEMDYDSTEIFNIFFANKEQSGGGGKTGGHQKVRFSDVVDGHGEDHSLSSGDDEMGSCDEDDERTDEDPCLIKDRKPEFAKNKSSKSKKVLRSYHNSPSETLIKKKNPKFLALPKRIPSDDEESDNEADIGAIAVAAGFSSAEGKHDNQVDIVDDVINTDDLIPLESSILEQPPPPASMLLCQNFDEDEYDNISECSEASESISSSSSSSHGIIATSSSSPPEYKQILTNLFSIFNNSKRKYPIPMYPFIQEARRQSGGGLIHHHSTGRNH